MRTSQTLALLSSIALSRADFLAPTSGDALEVNEEFTVEWETDGLVEPIDINLVPVGGSEQDAIEVASGIDNSGSVAFTPENVGDFDAFELVITDADDNTVTSEEFSISGGEEETDAAEEQGNGQSRGSAGAGRVSAAVEPVESQLETPGTRGRQGTQDVSSDDEDSEDTEAETTSTTGANQDGGNGNGRGAAGNGQGAGGNGQGAAGNGQGAAGNNAAAGGAGLPSGGGFVAFSGTDLTITPTVAINQGTQVAQPVQTAPAANVGLDAGAGVGVGVGAGLGAGAGQAQTAEINIQTALPAPSDDAVLDQLTPIASVPVLGGASTVVDSIAGVTPSVAAPLDVGAIGQTGALDVAPVVATAPVEAGAGLALVSNNAGGAATSIADPIATPAVDAGLGLDNTGAVPAAVDGVAGVDGVSSAVDGAILPSIDPLAPSGVIPDALAAATDVVADILGSATGLEVGAPAITPDPSLGLGDPSASILPNIPSGGEASISAGLPIPGGPVQPNLPDGINTDILNTDILNTDILNTGLPTPILPGDVSTTFSTNILSTPGSQSTGPGGLPVTDSTASTNTGEAPGAATEPVEAGAMGRLSSRTAVLGGIVVLVGMWVF